MGDSHPETLEPWLELIRSSPSEIFPPNGFEDKHTEKLGDAGAAAIAAALSGNQTVTEIRLYDQAIGDDGAAALAEAVAHCACRKLYLNKNQIGDAGTRALARCPR